MLFAILYLYSLQQHGDLFSSNRANVFVQFILIKYYKVFPLDRVDGRNREQPAYNNITNTAQVYHKFPLTAMPRDK